MIRIGQGVDVHAFSEDPERQLVLGGLVIGDGPGLAGHSDADVVLHALTDALLGAIARGDLGTLVGVDAEETRGMPSEQFLRRALDLLTAEDWSVGNVDLTIVAQRPRLAEHIEAMRERIATVMKIGPGRVSVKATTTDGLGLTGRGEGVACLAVAIVER